MDIAHMSAAKARHGSIEPAPQSKREIWFTLIRVTIVVILIAAAVGLIATAYAPKPSVSLLTSQQLSCPPDVVLHDETVVLPQVARVPEPFTPGVTCSLALFNKPDERTLDANGGEHRSRTKKPPPHAFVRNGVASKHTAKSELTKRGGAGVSQRSNPSTPDRTLAMSGISPSPFNDMHGQ